MMMMCILKRIFHQKSNIWYIDKIKPSKHIISIGNHEKGIQPPHNEMNCVYLEIDPRRYDSQSVWSQKTKRVLQKIAEHSLKFKGDPNFPFPPVKARIIFLFRSETELSILC